MSLSSESKCPDCGSPLGGATAELCRACVLRRLFEDGESGVLGLETVVPENRFGDYVLEGEIARGGMGIVYRARQANLGRVVALKVLNVQGLAGDKNEARFQEEVEAIAALDHPNIVPVYDHGKVDGRAFYTMKLIDGGPLPERIDLGGVEPGLAASLMAKTARAVHHAHERGLLHRDIKPSNILLDERDEPQVVDFGLARRLDSDSGLTVSGAVLGTPAYMSPEQAAGKNRSLTTAADVYGLGAVLYHLLVGRPPFEGDSQLDVLRRVADSDPAAPSTIIRRMDRDLSVICMKCLEKDPGDRYASALALAEDLERWMREEPIEARPAGSLERSWKWARRRPAVAALLAVSVFALIVITVISVMGQRQATQLARDKQLESEKALAAKAETELKAADLIRSLIRNEFQRAEDHFERNETPQGLAALARILRRDPSFKPAIMRVMSALDRRILAEPVFPPLTHDSPVRQAVFSHDDQKLATGTRAGVVRIWDADTGRALTLPLEHGDRIEFLAWSPDDRLLASASVGGSVKVWRAETGELARPEMRPGGYMLEFSESGELYSLGERPGKLLRWNPRTDETIVQPINGLQFPCHGSMTPDGSLLLVTQMDGKSVIHDTRTGVSQITGIPFEVSSVPLEFRGALNRAGTRALHYAGTVLQMPLYSLEERRAEHLWTHDQPVTKACFSPDESLVLTACEDGAVRLFRADSGKFYHRKFQHRASVTDARFSRDGKLVAVATDDETVSLWDVRNGQMILEGIRQHARITSVRFNGVGDRIVTASEDGSAVVWNLRRQRGHPGLILPRPSAAPLHSVAFTADDKRLFVASYGGRSAVYDTATGRQMGSGIPHSDKVAGAKITRDGSVVATATENGYLELADVETGEWKVPVIEVAPALSDIAMTPDGDRVMVIVRWHGFVEQRSVETGKRVLPRFYHARQEPAAAAYGPDGVLLYTGSGDRILRVWESGNAEALFESEPLDGLVNEVILSADGKRALVRTRSNMVTIWSAGRSPARRRGLRHSTEVSCAAFSPDGTRVVTGTAGGTVKIWDAESGRPLGRECGHDSPVVKAALSRDHSIVVSIASAGDAVVWDAETGFAVAEPVRFPSEGLDVAISDHGKLIAAAAKRSDVALFPMPTRPVDGPGPAWLAGLAEAYGSVRLSESDQMVRLSSTERDVRLQEITKAAGEDSYGRWLKAWNERRQSPE